MKPITIHVPELLATHYEVRIGSGLLAELGAAVKAVAPSLSCALITDSMVAPLFGDRAAASLSNAGYRVIKHVIRAGESHKNLETATEVFDALLEAKVERSTPVVALGGGVVGDLSGFVAATLLRGVPFVQVPTTLLAAVDASVGGKVGVDHSTGKNLIGAFHQPRLVLTDIATFATLPEREMRGGLAECIKHGVIRDASLFAFIAANVAKIQACDEPVMAELVTRNVAIKAAVVEEDPFEQGVRALLNFGHTFGHAIETVMHYTGVTHGEAVSLGMAAAARLAHHIGRFSYEDTRSLLTLLDYVGLPTSCPAFDVEKALAAMFADKKVKGGKIRLILPTKIGHAEIVSDITPEQLRWGFESLRQPIIAEKRQGL